jgi:hypothetical protein
MPEQYRIQALNSVGKGLKNFYKLSRTLAFQPSQTALFVQPGASAPGALVSMNFCGGVN